MYEPSNFVITTSVGNHIDLTTGAERKILINIQNQSDAETLYNLNFQIRLGDGLELINSTFPISFQENDMYKFTNIKDLAPNELTFELEVTVRMNSKYQDGSEIPFGTMVNMIFEASADTTPQGAYDVDNEVIQTTKENIVTVTRYMIYKESVTACLLGKLYTNKIIIKTAQNSGIFLRKLKNILGNGIEFLNQLEITGDITGDFLKYIVSVPTVGYEYYEIVWSDIEIPANSLITIRFDIKLNERYYNNGALTGLFITHGSQIEDNLQYQVNSEEQVVSLKKITAYELMIRLVLSDTKLDIFSQIIYTISFMCNLYHGVTSSSGTLTTTDGQVLADISVPMYTDKKIFNGTTQVLWNVGAISAGTSAEIIMEGNISKNYASSQLPIYTGDQFNASINCTAISPINNKVITDLDSVNVSIGIPTVEKSIVGYYDRNMFPKAINVGTPGDYVEYKMTYNSSKIIAPSRGVRLFDFYPYFTENLEDIKYTFSSPDYPSRGSVLVNPNGVLWYTRLIPGEQIFEITALTKLGDYNIVPQFYSNLFKVQVENSSGIGYAERASTQVLMGEPNLITIKNINGNNINYVKIGERYNVDVVLENNLSIGYTTDAFSFKLIETVPKYVTIDMESLQATVGNVSVQPMVEENKITVVIQKLAAGEKVSLTYDFIIDNTLPPNKVLISSSQYTRPYTQIFDETVTNTQYDIELKAENVVLKSGTMLVTFNTETKPHLVGNDIYYFYKLQIPEGVQINAFTVNILIPQEHSYLDEAWLDGEPVSAIFQNGTIIFPEITQIPSQTQTVEFDYLVKFKIDNALVSVEHPAYTIEAAYANINYQIADGENVSLGKNLNIQIENPYIVLNTGISIQMKNYLNSLILGENKVFYIRVNIQNEGNTIAKDTEVTVFVPKGVIIEDFISAFHVKSYEYNKEIRELTVIYDEIEVGQKGYLIGKAIIDKDVKAETKFIFISVIDHYYNVVSENKLYTSDTIIDTDIYVNSTLFFKPVSWYRLSDSMAAINISQIGEKTQIKYLLTNSSQGIDSFTVTTTAIAYDFDVYVNNMLIQSVAAGNQGIINNEILDNLESGSSRYIEFRYLISKDDPHYQVMLVSVESKRNPSVRSIIPTTLQDP